jgi:hypothetical protein
VAEEDERHNLNRSTNSGQQNKQNKTKVEARKWPPEMKCEKKSPVRAKRWSLTTIAREREAATAGEAIGKREDRQGRREEHLASS